MAKINDRNYDEFERRAKSGRVWRRVLLGVSLAAFLSPLLIDFRGTNQIFADTKIAKTIAQNTTMTTIDSNVSSVVFEGPYALTLVNGQTLNVAFTEKLKEGEISKPSVVFGQSGASSKQTWTMVSSSPAWIGVFNVLNGNTLEVKSTGSNPLGKYSASDSGEFSVVSLNSGATLKLSAILKNDGTPVENEVKAGALLTNVGNFNGETTIDVESAQTLTVENGAGFSGNVVKKGEGTLQVLVNKYANWDKYISNSTGKSYETIAAFAGSSDYDLGEASTTPVVIDSLNVQSGKFRVADGTGSIQSSNLSINSISLGSSAELDVAYAGTIKLTGGESSLVFSADDGAVVDLYVDANGYTSYVTEDFNAHMKVGAVTLFVDAKEQKSAANEMTVFATNNQGSIDYDKSKIAVVDNLLGRYYVLDEEKSSNSKIVLSQKETEKFSNLGKTPNERNAGASIDSAVDRWEYSESQFEVLRKLDENRDKLTLGTMTGELHATTVGFMYMNNLTTTQTLMEHMRNKQLVAYSGGSSVAPMDYGTGAGAGAGASAQQQNKSAAYYGGAAGGNFDQGPLYYNTDTNSYAPGVVPIYNNSGAGVYQTGYPSSGGYTGGVYNGETYGEGGYQYGTSESAPINGSYNLGWNGSLQRSALTTLRGQEAEYGDPGTLIYSAWVTSLGGTTDAKLHKDAYSYKGTQGGLIGGLDLFGSCDCRFGVFYGYQKNELKDKDENVLKGLGQGKLSTNDYLLGLYHQYGDETVYNIAMIRAGYDQYQTERVSNVLDSSATFRSKYNGYNAGASYERGANFAAEPFVFSPYASLDYNFLYRERFREDYATGAESFANNFGLISKKSMYHSLRGQLGGRVALDLYPASMQLRFVLRAAYIHEFLNAMYGKTELCYSSLQECAPYFTVNGNSLGRDWAVTGLGIDWTPIPCLVIAAKSDCLWNKYVTDAYGSLGLKFRW